MIDLLELLHLLKVRVWNDRDVLSPCIHREALLLRRAKASVVASLVEVLPHNAV